MFLSAVHIKFVVAKASEDGAGGLSAAIKGVTMRQLNCNNSAFAISYVTDIKEEIGSGGENGMPSPW